MVTKKEITKHLLLVKEEKEKKLIQEQLVTNRIKSVMENINTLEDFESLPKGKKEKLSFYILQELSQLENIGLLNEQSLGDMFSNIFGKNIMSSALQTIADPFLDKLLTSVGLQGTFKSFLKSVILTKPTRLIKALRDCREGARLVAEGLAEAMVEQFQNKQGYTGPIYTYLRNALGQAIDSNPFIEGIEKTISDKVCEVYSSLWKRAKNMMGGSDETTQTQTAAA